MSKEQQSIFELSEMEARKILVDAINHLTKRCDRQSKLITQLDENVLNLQRQVDELEGELDSLKTGVDALR